MVQVSAKKRQNLDALLETILLTSDILESARQPDASGLGRGARSKTRSRSRLGGDGAGATRNAARSAIRSSSVRSSARCARCSTIAARPSPKLGQRRRSKCSDCRACRRPARAFQVVADITRAQQISQHRQMLERQARCCKRPSVVSKRWARVKSRNCWSSSRPTCRVQSKF